MSETNKILIRDRQSPSRRRKELAPGPTKEGRPFGLGGQRRRPTRTNVLLTWPPQTTRGPRPPKEEEAINRFEDLLRLPLTRRQPRAASTRRPNLFRKRGVIRTEKRGSDELNSADEAETKSNKKSPGCCSYAKPHFAPNPVAASGGRGRGVIKGATPLLPPPSEIGLSICGTQKGGGSSSVRDNRKTLTPSTCRFH